MTSALLTPPATLTLSVSGDTPVQPIGRVVLIDPREERRAITSLLVDRCPSLTVVGSAGTLAEAESQIRAEQADIALLEIQMPVTEGLTTITALRDQFPDLRIVVCSFHRDAITCEEARAHGADGYLTKPLDIGDLLALAVGPRVSVGGPSDGE